MILSKKLLILLAFLFVFLVLFSLVDSLLLWDENAYLGNARSHLTQSNYTENFRFPLLEWIITAFWVLGESIFIAKLAMILFSLGTAVLVYLIADKLFKERAFFLTLIYSLSYLFLYWGFRIYTEPVMLFFILLSFYLVIKNNYWLAGIFSGLAFLAKFPSAIFALSVFLFLIYKKEFKNLAKFSLFFCLPLVPWLISNYIVHGNILWDFIQQYNIVEAYTAAQPFFEGLRSLFSSIGLLIIFLPFGFYSLLKRKIKYAEIMLLFSFLTLVYVLFFVNIKYARYFFGILPFLIFIAYDGADFIKKKLKITELINILIIISVIISLIFAVNDLNNESYCSSDSAIQQSLNYLKLKTDPNDFIVSNYWPYLGYSLNSRIFSIWAADIDVLLSYDPEYFAVHNRIGAVDLKIFDNNQFELEKEITGKCGEKVFIYRVK